jgi:hypothetical protein
MIELELEQENELVEMHQNLGCQAVVEFLVAGLMSRIAPIRQQCIVTLVSMGAQVADRLNALLDTGNLSSTHRKRVHAALTLAIAAETASPEAENMLLRTILCVIKHGVPRLHRQGLEAGKYLQRGFLSDVIVDEALTHQSDIRYFDRLLRAVAASGMRSSAAREAQIVKFYYCSESVSIRRSCGNLIKKINLGELEKPEYPGGIEPPPLREYGRENWSEASNPIEPSPAVSDLV